MPTGAVAEKVRIGGILHWRHLTRLGVMSIPDRPGIAAAILSSLGERQINVPFVVQCIDLHRHTHVIFCVSRDDAASAREAMERLRHELPAAALVEEPGIAIVAIFGPDFRERPGIAAAMCAALTGVGINILAISTSISTVSCIIDESAVDRAIEALQAAFDLP
ncbi:MAG: ACT domain-containing protein [Anaerolineae bacterium]